MCLSGNKELGWLVWNRAYFIISEYPLKSIGDFFSKFTGNISWKCSTDIPRTYTCPMGSKFAPRKEEVGFGDFQKTSNSIQSFFKKGKKYVQIFFLKKVAGIPFQVYHFNKSGKIFLSIFQWIFNFQLFMATSGKGSNTVMQYEQTLFYEEIKKLPCHLEAF